MYYIFEALGEKVIFVPYPRVDQLYDCPRVFGIVSHDFNNKLRPKGFEFWPPIANIKKLENWEVVKYILEGIVLNENDSEEKNS